ncbi:MAG: phosphate acyltransferase PlsX [Cyanothece sp. SIO2G6]|nr:phosphate acyltransferase PlsX [Cyanothece sp. SIO2G6]
MGSTQVRIALDAMGGDYAPDEIVIGAARARDELGVKVLLVGDPQAIATTLDANGYDSAGMEIVPADDIIGMDEEPLQSVRRKPKSSINVAMSLVKQDQADAMISAGHSGAVMASALLRLGRLKGIDRPAIGAVFPTVQSDKPVLILDVGANVDCRPKFLEQFAVMGSVYSRSVLGSPDPQVGLLNIGEEASKGNDLALRAYSRLEKNTNITFKGNAEGRDVLSGDFDVIVCDGFVGNVLLKFAEAVGGSLLQIIKEELPKGVNGKVGAAILKPNLRQIKRRMDHAEYGGGLLLGVNGICIIGHGSSRAASVFNAIRIAKEAVEQQVLGQMQSLHQKVATVAVEAAEGE